MEAASRVYCHSQSCTMLLRHNVKYIYLFTYVLTDKTGQIHFDRCEIATDSEISSLAELEVFEAKVLRIHRDKAVECRLSSPPYMLRVEQTSEVALNLGD